MRKSKYAKLLEMTGHPMTVREMYDAQFELFKYNPIEGEPIPDNVEGPDYWGDYYTTYPTGSLGIFSGNCSAAWRRGKLTREKNAQGVYVYSLPKE
jgi:hypothetical protein